MKNPKRYRELSEPFASEATANEALTAFQEELSELRVKHRITDLHVIMMGSYVGDEEEEQTFLTNAHLGDPLKAATMTAWAYGREQAEQEALLKRALSSAIRRTHRENSCGAR